MLCAENWLSISDGVGMGVVSGSGEALDGEGRGEEDCLIAFLGDGSG